MKKYLVLFFICTALTGMCLNGCTSENRPVPSETEAQMQPSEPASDSVTAKADGAVSGSGAKHTQTGGADETKEPEAQGDTYYLQAEEESVFVPSLTLFADGSFSFVYDVLSSYFACGTYELKDGRLTAVTNDGLYSYVFEVGEGRYTFVQPESSDVSLIDENAGVSIGDGSVFVLEGTQGKERMTAVVKEISSDSLLVSSRTEEFPGAYYVYFGDLDISGITGGDEINIYWDGSVLETSPAQIYADRLELRK